MAFYFDPEYGYGVFALDDRSFGYSVRAVRCKNSVVNVTANTMEGGEVSGGSTYMDCTNCTVSAIASENYIFTSWTENGEVVSRDANYTFMVSGNRDLVANFTCKYVDLGLPSGILWASCNVGASTPEGYGDYFAWGETQPKEEYNLNTYQYYNNGYIKYCTDAFYGYNGFTDNLTTLLPEDDAATANLGGNWRMPTTTEWIELLQNTTCTWTTQYGVCGRLMTASNGNSLFLPAAGYRSDSNLHDAGSYGHYWSASLFNFIQYWPYAAECFYFYLHEYSINGYGEYTISGDRSMGFTVRPVCSGQN